MVEMLGMLAIIGVLSIGGLNAYRIAMNSYKANEILNYVNLVGSQKFVQLFEAKNADIELTPCSELVDGKECEYFDVCFAAQSDGTFIVNFVLFKEHQGIATSLVNKLGIDPKGADGSATLSFCMTNQFSNGNTTYENRACDGFENP